MTQFNRRAETKTGDDRKEAGARIIRDGTREDIDIARAVFRDEIEGLKEVQAHLDASFHRAVDAIYKCRGRLIISGVGKSGLIAKKIAATLTSTGTPSFYLHPVDAVHGDLGLVSSEDVVLIISKSGASDELRQLLPALGRLNVTIIAMTGSGSSYLAEHSDIVLDTHVKREACALDLAPTTSTTASLVLGDALANALVKRRGFQKEDFARFHPSGILGKKLTLRVQELMRTGDDVPIVDLNTGLKEALIEITAKRVGCVGVVDEDNKLCGIITDGDLKRILVREPNALDLAVSAVMTRNPKTIGATVLAADALSAMEINPSGPITMSPPSSGRKPAQTYSECPVPLPNCQAPLTR